MLWLPPTPVVVNEKAKKMDYKKNKLGFFFSLRFLIKGSVTYVG